MQINSTITKLNVDYLDDLLALSEELGAVAFHPFLLVPTGRGKELGPEELPPEDYERTLNWVYDRQKTSSIFFKPTDAPHYHRIMRQRAKEDGTDLETLKMHPHSHAAMAGGVGKAHGHGDMDSPFQGLPGRYGLLLHQSRRAACSPVATSTWRPATSRRRSSRRSGAPRRCSRICATSRSSRASAASASTAGSAAVAVPGPTRSRGDYLAEEPYCVYEPVRKGC